MMFSVPEEHLNGDQLLQIVDTGDGGKMLQVVPPTAAAAAAPPTTAPHTTAPLYHGDPSAVFFQHQQYQYMQHQQYMQFMQQQQQGPMQHYFPPFSPPMSGGSVLDGFIGPDGVFYAINHTPAVAPAAAPSSAAPSDAEAEGEIKTDVEEPDAAAGSEAAAAAATVCTDDETKVAPPEVAPPEAEVAKVEEDATVVAITEELKTTKEALSAVQRQMQVQASRIKQLEGEATTLRANRKQRKTAVRHATTAMKEAEKRCSALRKKLDQARVDEAETEAQLQTAREGSERAEHALTELQDTVQQLTKSNGKWEETTRARDREIERLQADAKEIVQEGREREAAHRALLQEMEKLKVTTSRPASTALISKLAQAVREEASTRLEAEKAAMDSARVQGELQRALETSEAMLQAAATKTCAQQLIVDTLKQEMKAQTQKLATTLEFTDKLKERLRERFAKQKYLDKANELLDEAQHQNAVTIAEEELMDQRQACGCTILRRCQLLFSTPDDAVVIAATLKMAAVDDRVRTLLVEACDHDEEQVTGLLMAARTGTPLMGMSGAAHCMVKFLDLLWAHRFPLVTEAWFINNPDEPLPQDINAETRNQRNVLPPSVSEARLGHSAAHGVVVQCVLSACHWFGDALLSMGEKVAGRGYTVPEAQAIRRLQLKTLQAIQATIFQSHTNKGVWLTATRIFVAASAATKLEALCTPGEVDVEALETQGSVLAVHLALLWKVLFMRFGTNASIFNIVRSLLGKHSDFLSQFIPCVGNQNVTVTALLHRISISVATTGGNLRISQHPMGHFMTERAAFFASRAAIEFSPLGEWEAELRHITQMFIHARLTRPMCSCCRAPDAPTTINEVLTTLKLTTDALNACISMTAAHATASLALEVLEDGDAKIAEVLVQAHNQLDKLCGRCQMSATIGSTNTHTIMTAHYGCAALIEGVEGKLLIGSKVRQRLVDLYNHMMAQTREETKFDTDVESDSDATEEDSSDAESEDGAAASPTQIHLGRTGRVEVRVKKASVAAVALALLPPGVAKGRDPMAVHSTMGPLGRSDITMGIHHFLALAPEVMDMWFMGEAHGSLMCTPRMLSTLQTVPSTACLTNGEALVPPITSRTGMDTFVEAQVATVTKEIRAAQKEFGVPLTECFESYAVALQTKFGGRGSSGINNTANALKSLTTEVDRALNYLLSGEPRILIPDMRMVRVVKKWAFKQRKGKTKGKRHRRGKK